MTRTQRSRKGSRRGRGKGRNEKNAAGFRATATACANIALAKYWGKSDVELNLPAVPSISMTLDGLVTETTVAFEPWLDHDVVHLDGRYASGEEARRVVELLDRVREAARMHMAARVVTENRFPTAAGLASSASGFAALAAAATRAAGLVWTDAQLSRLARRSSASAARSIFGGFVELPRGRPGRDSLAARALHPRGHWNLRMVLALTAKGKKKVGSTSGMERSRRTSPYYEAWVEAAPKYARRIKRALADKHLDRLGRAMEQSTLAFHACAMASDPGIIYFQPATLAALTTVRRLREDRGIPAYATMDAGPHVKVLCRGRDADAVRRALGRTEGVLHTLVCRPGPAVKVKRAR
ncbi:MAG: diphosphomevalonate decarboxylase [Myxococcota bacterium]